MNSENIIQDTICKFPPRAGYLLNPENTNSQFEITSVRFLDKRLKKTVLLPSHQ